MHRVTTWNYTRIREFLQSIKLVKYSNTPVIWRLACSCQLWLFNITNNGLHKFLFRRRLTLKIKIKNKHFDGWLRASVPFRRGTPNKPFISWPSTFFNMMRNFSIWCADQVLPQRLVPRISIIVLFCLLSFRRCLTTNASCWLASFMFSMLARLTT